MKTLTIRKSTLPALQPILTPTYKVSQAHTIWGYVVTSCRETGNRWPVDKEGNRVDLSDPDSDQKVAVYRSRLHATTAMHALTPMGTTPACWDGFAVRLAYESAALWLAAGQCEGMHGFVVPIMD